MVNLKRIPNSNKQNQEAYEEELSSLCKALGHPARVRLLKLLIDKKSCITGNLADELPLALSTVSEHLRILKNAGLVQGIIDGPRRCYCVNHEVLNHLKDLVRDL